MYCCLEKNFREESYFLFHDHDFFVLMASNDACHMPCTKMSSKRIRDLNVKSQNYKTLRRKHRRKSSRLSCGSLGMTPKAQVTKKGKTHSIGWEKIFTSHMSDKGLVSRIIKEVFLQLNNKKIA